MLAREHSKKLKKEVWQFLFLRNHHNWLQPNLLLLFMTLSQREFQRVDMTFRSLEICSFRLESCSCNILFPKFVKSSAELIWPTMSVIKAWKKKEDCCPVRKIYWWMTFEEIARLVIVVGSSRILALTYDFAACFFFTPKMSPYAELIYSVFTMKVAQKP